MRFVAQIYGARRIHHLDARFDAVRNVHDLLEMLLIQLKNDPARTNVLLLNSSTHFGEICRQVDGCLHGLTQDDDFLLFDHSKDGADGDVGFLDKAHSLADASGEWEGYSVRHFIK